MAGPALRVGLRLLATGGQDSPVHDGDRLSWDLGNRWLGTPVMNDGTIVLDDCTMLAPGSECLARIVPAAPEFWGGVRVGAVVAFHAATRVAGYATINVQSRRCRRRRRVRRPGS